MICFWTVLGAPQRLPERFFRKSSWRLPRDFHGDFLEASWKLPEGFLKTSRRPPGGFKAVSWRLPKIV